VSDLQASRLAVNNGTPVSSVVVESLSWASEAYLCVAYARYGAFEILKSELEGLLRRGGKLRAIFDVERVVTDPSIIEEISTIPGDSACRVIYKRPEDPSSDDHDLSGVFHPKLYLFQNGHRTRILIGSSNLTRGGLEKNVEANVAIDGQATDELWQEAIAYFQAQWNAREAINPEESDFIERYKERWKTHHQLRRNLERRLIKVRSAVEGIFKV
jgi:HKD family nuclease